MNALTRIFEGFRKLLTLEINLSLFFHIKVFFFCVKEPVDGCGGETPLVKNSELIARLNPEVVRKLEEKQIRYVRYWPNEAPGVHLSWQRSYVTNDRKVSLIYIPSFAVSHVMYIT